MFSIVITGATISADTMDFLTSLKSFAFIAIVTVLCILGSRIISFLNEKIKDQVTKAIENSKLAKFEDAHQAMNDIIEIIHDTVERLNQTVKSEILKASKDGKLTKDEGQKIFDEAIRIIKECATESMMDDLSSIVGNVDEWITNQIEIWVAATKNKN